MKDFKAKMYQMKQNQMRNSLNVTSETKPGKKPTKLSLCLQNISQTGTIHPGIFRGRTLRADNRELKHEDFSRRRRGET